MVTVTGSGFGAYETGITITFDGSPVASAISADSQGNWSGTFTVPASPSGAHTLNAYGSITPTSSDSRHNLRGEPHHCRQSDKRASGQSGDRYRLWLWRR